MGPQFWAYMEGVGLLVAIYWLEFVGGGYVGFASIFLGGIYWVVWLGLICWMECTCWGLLGGVHWVRCTRSGSCCQV